MRACWAHWIYITSDRYFFAFLHTAGRPFHVGRCLTDLSSGHAMMGPVWHLQTHMPHATACVGDSHASCHKLWPAGRRLDVSPDA